MCRAWRAALAQAQAPVHSVTLRDSPACAGKMAWVARTRPAVVRLRIGFSSSSDEDSGNKEALAAAMAALPPQVCWFSV